MIKNHQNKLELDQLWAATNACFCIHTDIWCHTFFYIFTSGLSPLSQWLWALISNCVTHPKRSAAAEKAALFFSKAKLTFRLVWTETHILLYYFKFNRSSFGHPLGNEDIVNQPYWLTTSCIKKLILEHESFLLNLK